MPSRLTSVIGAVCILAVVGSSDAVRAQGPVPPTDVVAIGAPAMAKLVVAQSTQPPPAQPRVAPAMRGRWGGGFGVLSFGGKATFDYTNSPTPFAGTSGPYTGAVLETDHVGPGFLFSGGYRGPVHPGSKLGFGFDGEFGGGGGHPAEKRVNGRSPTGVQVTFSTERGGIIDMVTAGGGGHVSYNLARRVNVMGGLNVSALRVKPSFGSYLGLTPPPPGGVFFLATASDRSPIFWRTATTPWVGAELFLWEHGSIDL